MAIYALFAWNLPGMDSSTGQLDDARLPTYQPILLALSTQSLEGQADRR